jgi:hypothetical protein
MLEKLKPLFNKNNAKQAYYKAKPYVRLISFAAISFLAFLGIYVLDAIRNAVDRARAEPFIALAAFATIIYAVFAYRQWDVMNSQLETLKRQLSDSEILESASLSIRNMKVVRLGDVILDFDLVNAGHTRADQINCPIVINTNVKQNTSEQFGTKGLWGTPPSPHGFSLNPTDQSVHFSQNFGQIGVGNNISFLILCGYLDVFKETGHVAGCSISHPDGGIEPCLGITESHY